MKKIVLGRTGVNVSRISLGTWSFGGASVSSNNQPVGWAGQTEIDSQLALQKAHEVGINHWDTADVYGNGISESIIGTMWNKVSRNEIFLATKIGWDMGSYDHWYHPMQMKINMERSLKNLKVNCVDLMYLHHCNFGKQDEYFEEALEVIKKFQEEGKTRFIGLSDWSSNKIMKFISRVNPDVIQPYRNVMDDTYASTGLKNYVEANNLGICFFSPLKHGLLTGKYTEPATFETGDFRKTVKDFADQKLIDKMKTNKSKLEERFANHPEPVMHGLVDALLTDVPTGCVLLGQRNVEQVEAAAQLGEALSNEDGDWVNGLYKG
jgi:aryl-alcohol dehydrogenase-like predicted oxidoreductase